MELYQLRSFVAIVEAGQLTRAAEKLHVSQPALSAQLRALEEELDLPLFERKPSGMVLTAAGKKILKAANKVLAAASALQNEARLIKGKVAGKVSIGTLSDPDFIRLGEFMNEAVARFPLLQLELHQEVTGVAMERVAAGELDASFYYGDISNQDIAGLPLRDMIYRVTGPAEWRDRIEGAGWDEIAALPWIIPPPISSHHKLVRTMLHEHGVDVGNVVEADHETVVSSLVVSGLGLALMREDRAMARVAEGKVCIWNDVRINTTLWFIYQRERRNDPVIRALLSVQEKLWDMQSENPGNKPQAAAGARAVATALG
ncbi:MAG: LysR family transcriptional regulator [Usitatibacteraceae bacterium]